MTGSRFGVAVSVCALMASGAIAQEVTDADVADAQDQESRQETVIIQGTKLGLSVQEADVSVEVFDEVRLERESIFDLDDALLRAPNVAINGNTNSLTIRGINRFGAGGTGVTSNIYIDGLPLNQTGLTFGLESVWDTAQIEVLRGPQSTVQGRNALAGAVVVQTADPSYDWLFKGRARVAEHGTEQYAATVSGPIIEDQVAFRLAADYQKRDGYIDVVNPTTGELADQDFLESTLIRGKLLLEPNAIPDLRAELSYEYVNTNVGIVGDFVTAGALRPGGGANDDLPLSDPGYNDFDPNGGTSFADLQTNDTRIDRTIVDLSYDLTDAIEIKALGTYEEIQRDRVIGDPINFTFGQNGINDDLIKTYTGELSANFDFGKLTGNLGTYYFENESDLVFDILVPVSGLIPPGITINPPDTLLIANTTTATDTENYAFYGQARYEINDKWVVSFGLRYDSEKFNTTGLLATTSLDPETCLATVPGFFINVPLPTVDVPCTVLLPATDPVPGQTDEFNAWLPRASVTYNWTDDISTYLAVQRGYRAGGTYVQRTTDDGTVTGAPLTIVGTFDPEFLTNFEIGFRSQFFDNDLTVNATLFHSILEDQQIVLNGPTGGVLDTFTDNAGESELNGFEMSVDYRINDEWDVYGSLGLLSSEFTDFPFATGPQAPVGNAFTTLNGNTPPLSPETTLTIGGSYNSNAGYFADVSANFTAQSESDIANITAADLTNLNNQVVLSGSPLTAAERDVLSANAIDEASDDRTTVNVRLGYRGDNFTIAAFATNLFDDDGLIQRNYGSVLRQNGDINIFPNPNFTIQQPRTVGVQLDVEF
ncbi:MAG: TonB-dependent receptor [Pseudomonadota bacterium]